MAYGIQPGPNLILNFLSSINFLNYKFLNFINFLNHKFCY